MYLQELMMNMKHLTESMEGESDGQSTLESELANKKVVILELKKEIEVIICNHCMCIYMTRKYFI